MRDIKRSIATLELLLVLPASLFMAALFLREVQPPPFEPAQTARHVIDWFAASPRIGLQLFLMAMPFAALLIGASTVLRAWRTDAQLRQAASQTLAAVRVHFASLFIASATLLAAGILTIVALHLITE